MIRYTLDLTKEEQIHVRTTLRYLKTRFGTWDSMAKVMKVRATRLSDLACGRVTVSPNIAFRAARVAQASIDDVLAGRFPPAGTCPYCGHCKGDE